MEVVSYVRWQINTEERLSDLAIKWSDLAKEQLVWNGEDKSYTMLDLGKNGNVEESRLYIVFIMWQQVLR